MSDDLIGPPIVVPRDSCRDFERSSRLEWLETNHTGAYAMGTIAGVNTRCYHGLLIAPLNPPADRHSFLARLEEQVLADGQISELGAAQYPGAVCPRGFSLLNEFRIDPFPTWSYEAGKVTVKKTVFLVDREPAVCVLYQANGTCRIRIRLFCSFRDYHSQTHQNSVLRDEIVARPGSLAFHPYPSLPSLTIFHSGADFERDSQWFLNNEYLRDFERGLNFREDLFSPGCLEFDLNGEGSIWIIASTNANIDPVSSLSAQVVGTAPRMSLKKSAQAQKCSKSPLLSRALDQFRIVRGDGRPSLLAGYPWFTDWSRDTLISLPAIEGVQEAKSILTLLLNERSQGLVPNRFSDHGSAPEYNTADATLWLFVAAHRLLEKTGDLEFLNTVVYPAAVDILDWHFRGTHYNIHADPNDRLLWAGTPDVQLTWMDAKIGDRVVTPRDGKPVEINALWYNALKIMAVWAKVLGRGEDCARFNGEAEPVLSSFRAAFWNEERSCLYDVVKGSEREASFRPNQIFACSLPFPLLDRQRARLMMEQIKEKLLTPVGLRTLEPGDRAYKPRYGGGVWERDSAYHQGAVWPWLFGPFVDAYLYAYDDFEEAKEYCCGILERFEREFTACCLGSFSEVYDGDPPHRPGGCPAQLWSVAQFILAQRRLLA